MFKISLKLFRFCCLHSFCFSSSKIKYSANLFPSVFGIPVIYLRYFFSKIQAFFPFARFLETLLFLMWECSQLKIIRVVGNLCTVQVILGSLFPCHIPRQNKFSLFTTVFLFLFLRLQTSGFHTSNRAWRNNSVAMLTISFDEASSNLD